MSEKENYFVTIDISWEECVAANSEDEAIEKLLSKYKYGKGRIPREYTEVFIDDNGLGNQVD